MFGIQPTSSGVDVNEQSMMTLSAVFRALHLWADLLAHLPRHLYRREMGRGSSPDLIASEHPLDWALYLQPNPEQSAYQFWEYMLLSWWVWGNSLAEVSRNSAGQATELWPLDPRRTRMVRTESGAVWYEITLHEGGVARLPRDRVFHVSQGLNRGWGCGFVEYAKRSLGVAIASDEYASATYGNNGRPGGILKLTGRHSELSGDSKDRMRRDFVEAHEGLSNVQRVSILEEGIEWQDVGFDPQETQLLDARKFSVSEVARWTNLPEHLLGGLEKATFSNIDQQSLELIVYRVNPMAVRFEQACDTQLLAPEDRRDYFAKFNLKALLRGDPASRSDYFTKMFQMGALSPNDILNLEDLPPYEGGDVRLVPMNMVPTEQAGIPQTIAAEPRSAEPSRIRFPLPTPAVELRQRESNARKRSAVVRASRERFILAALRVAIEEKRRVDAAAQRYLRTDPEPTIEAKGIEAFQEWVEGFYRGDADFRGWTVEEQLLPAFRALSLELAEMSAAEAEGQQLGDAQVEEISAWLADNAAWTRGASSQGQIGQLVQSHSDADLLADAIEDRTSEWVGDSSARKPRSNGEGMVWGKAISGAIAKATFSAAGYTAIRWVSIGKSCPACESLDGKTVGIESDQPFARKGERVGNAASGQEPVKQRRDTFQPPLHGGCDCEITRG